MYCPKCGKELRDTARFCVSCGYQVPARGNVKQKQRQPSFDNVQTTGPSLAGMGVSALQGKTKIFLIAGIAAFALVLAVVLILVIVKPFAKSPVANVHVGDIIHLGEVSFDAYWGGQFKDDIAWRVLAIEDGRVLVIAEDIIDLRPYNEKYEDITWEQSTIRQWLNTDFYNGLPEKVKQYVATTLLINTDNSYYGTPGGNNTTDKVFLLSIYEAEWYFRSCATRQAGINLTPETIRWYNGEWGGDIEQIVREYGGWWWWLRSPDYFASGAANVVCLDGEIIDFDFGDRGVFVDDNFVDNDLVGIRPAMWISM